MGICESFRLSKVVIKLVNKPVLMPLRWACELDADAPMTSRRSLATMTSALGLALPAHSRPPLRPARQ